MSIRLDPVDGAKQFLTILPDGSWSSPAGGWLEGGGKAVQDASGLSLRDENGLRRLRLMNAGLAMTMPSNGRFEEENESPASSAMNGTWTLNDVSG